ncbi:MAG TPA: S8 family serine peptidase [Candidatus Deferrimicrobium sp.]|nr:S8 family serine peptidase [Candidatus Deferrimicrobium sp.]
MYWKVERDCAAAAALLCLLYTFPASASTRLSPALSKVVVERASIKPDTLIDVIVFLDDNRVQSNAALSQLHPSPTRDERIKLVVGKLQAYRSQNADRLERFLETAGARNVSNYWITPAFSAMVPISSLQPLASQEGVTAVVEDAPLVPIDPISIAPAPVLAAGVSAQLSRLRVPSLWSRGLTGRGRLVCSFDTGVEQSHPALAPKWRGNGAPLSAAWFSTLTPDSLPSDKIGHGTHTMGLMVGASMTDTFGVAPDAEWITAGVIDQGKSLGNTISDILLAFQWALNPDGDTGTTSDVPDVILNSWGIPKGLFAPCDATFNGVIDNVEAAGIVTVFAAGNEGPDPRTIRNPADQATSPLNTLSVGAIDNNDVITGFSSRGPSSCDGTRIKPELVAPGVAIRSSYKGGGYYTMTGTSMSAPYIAGLVALMRQYNPDVTVAEIKYALVQSCTDLGPLGEDNSYGYGLPDASRLVDYLPEPTPPAFTIKRVMISDDGIASPGEEFGLQLLLYNAEGNVEQATATLRSMSNDSAIVVGSNAAFYFGSGGTTALNSEPFVVRFDSTFYHGQQLPFAVVLESPLRAAYDTLDLILTVGLPPNGSIALHATSRMEVTVSDFGQYGFAPGSFYNLQGEGFRYGGSPNLLYEAGIVVARNPLQLAHAVRDSLGRLAVSDFMPTRTLSIGWTDEEGGFHRDADLADVHSEIRIPISISQETISYPYGDDNGMLILSYYLKNDSIEKLSNLYFGFLADFDLLGDGELVSFDQARNLLYQHSDAGPAVGLVGLSNVRSFTIIANGTAKKGFTREELFAIVSSGLVDSGVDSAGDMLTIVGAGPFTIDARDSVQVALALVGGDNVAAVLAQAEAARQRFELTTDVIDPERILPGDFGLNQNYPNPFNPTTTISFQLTEADDVTLDVYNLLGQRVRTLVSERLPAGSHAVVWDGTNDDGEKVATGVYLYRLVTTAGTRTRRMMLLK